MNTIEDMQNEKYFFYHCNMFDNNHDDTLLYKYIYISMYTKYNYMYMCESILTLSTS